MSFVLEKLVMAGPIFFGLLIFGSMWAPSLSSGMKYHLIRHLFPAIPLNKTPAAYRELKPLLEAEGVRLNNL